MSEIITPAEALHEAVTDLVEQSECELFEAIGVLDVVKAELTLASLAADEDEADEDEADEDDPAVLSLPPLAVAPVPLLAKRPGKFFREDFEGDGDGVVGE